MICFSPRLNKYQSLMGRDLRTIIPKYERDFNKTKINYDKTAQNLTPLKVNDKARLVVSSVHIRTQITS